MNKLVIKFPEVFAKVIDENNNEILAIKKDATLEDLFEVYSEIVHYIDGKVITILEELIKEKMRETPKNRG
jgi:hypothetical protein